MMKWTSSNSSLNSPNDRKSVFYTNTEVTGIIKVNRKITISIRLTLKNEKYVAWKWDIKFLCHFRAWRNRSRNRLRKWINIIKYIELINWIKYVSFSRRHEQYCIHFHSYLCDIFEQIPVDDWKYLILNWNCFLLWTFRPVVSVVSNLCYLFFQFNFFCSFHCESFLFLLFSHTKYCEIWPWIG